MIRRSAETWVAKSDWGQVDFFPPEFNRHWSNLIRGDQIVQEAVGLDWSGQARGGRVGSGQSRSGDCPSTEFGHPPPDLAAWPPSSESSVLVFSHSKLTDWLVSTVMVSITPCPSPCAPTTLHHIFLMKNYFLFLFFTCSFFFLRIFSMCYRSA